MPRWRLVIIAVIALAAGTLAARWVARDPPYDAPRRPHHRDAGATPAPDAGLSDALSR